MKKFVNLFIFGLINTFCIAENSVAQSPTSQTPTVQEPVTLRKMVDRLWDIPQELLFKDLTDDPIQNDAPPFFSYVPNANYPAAYFNSTTLPSTQVNVAKYAKSPIKNERQSTTEIPGLFNLTTTSFLTNGNSSTSTQTRGVNVNYMFDGIPLARIPGQAADGLFLALPKLADVERIDYYNNASNLLGASGFNTINYVTRNPSRDTVARFKTNHAFSSTGEYGTNSSIDGTVDSFGYYLTMNHNQSDGVRHNADFSDYYASAKFIIDLNKETLLTLGYVKNQFEAGEPGTLTAIQYGSNRNFGASQASNGTRVWNDRDTGYIKLNHQLSDVTQFELNGYGFINETLSRATSTVNTTTSVNIRKASVIGANGKLSHQWDIQGEKQLLNLGGQFSSHRETLNNALTTALSLNDTRGRAESTAQTYDGGIFAENRFQWGKLSVTPGFRLDFVSFAIHDNFNHLRTRGFSQIDRTIVDVVPKLSLSTSYEILNQTELFFNVMQDHVSYDVLTTGSTLSSALISSGNYSLERILKYEAGGRGKIRPWSDYSASLFVIDHDNLKQSFTRNGVTIVEDNTRNYIRGAEMQMRIVATHLWQDLFERRSVYSPSEWGDLAFSGNILLMDAQQEGGINNDRQVVLSPDFVVKGGVYYNYENRILVNLTGQWVERYFTSADNNLNSNVPGFMVWDFNVDYWIIKDHLKIMAGIHNLLDEDYYTTNGNSAIAPAPERTYYLGAGLSF